MRGTYFTTALRINNQAADYTATIEDWLSDTITTMTSGSANNYIIPLNSSVNFPIGTQLLVAQEGLGQTTIVATSGVTINAIGLSISSRYKSVALIQVALNEWDAYGTLDAASSYTARTTAFATATAITDTTILNALNTFDLGLISNSLDTKMKAIYPFVGTTATTQKYNFMDARDLDVAFRLSFGGGGSHSSTGYLPNGTNAFADTNLNPSANISLDSVHLSYYSRTITTGLQSEIGAYTSINDTGTFLSYNYSAGNYKGLNASSTNVGTQFSPSTGFLLASRINSTTEKYYWKGILTDTLSKSSKGLITSNIYVGAHNVNGSPYNYSAKEVAFASIGSGFTDGEASTFYTLVQNMQVSLARAV